MTPLERAARALYDRLPHVVEWDDLSQSAKDENIAVARAVLEAIREPSEGMVREGCLADFPGGRFGEATFTEAHIGEDDAPVIWQAMIDAALSEGAEG